MAAKARAVESVVTAYTIEQPADVNEIIIRVSEVITVRDGDPKGVVPGSMAIGEAACISALGSNQFRFWTSQSSAERPRRERRRP